MTKFLLAAGVAALAFTAPALAGPGGRDGGPGGGKSDQAGKQDRGQGGSQDRGRGSMKAAARDGNGRGAMRIADRGRRDNQMARGRRGPEMKAERGRMGMRQTEHARIAMRQDGGHAAGRMNDGVRVRDLNDNNRGFQARFGLNGRAIGLADGCPPGLAAKHNGCLPPGQAKKLVGALLPRAYARSMLSGPYSNWYRDDQRYMYRMGDNYIYRVDRSNNLVNALIPYVNRDFSYYPVGQMYPSDFNYYNVPYQYQSYYPDGGQYDYRYGSGAIYSLDPQTQAVQSIVALLAGDLGVGQRMPQNYGVYNVPLQYRDQYADSATDMYRYNDGYIYRADPTTRLITAVVNALV